MCIALISTAHPNYSLILIDNRDEYIGRPTAPATWWPSPHEHVLGGRDLLRSAHGTWLGTTKDGRIAVLTNFREEAALAFGAESRGAMMTAFLSSPESEKQTTEQFVKSLIASRAPQKVGGFSLVCGRVGEPLAVISNRVSSEKGISWIARHEGETVGLSNAAFGDRSWPKIVSGEKLVQEAVAASVEEAENEDQLVERLLQVLSTDTLPKYANHEEDHLEADLPDLRATIFVPLIGHATGQEKSSDEMRKADAKEQVDVLETKDERGNVHSKSEGLFMSGLYGTMKQTVVLCKPSGEIRFVERTLYGNDSLAVKRGEGDVDHKFNVR